MKRRRPSLARLAAIAKEQNMVLIIGRDGEYRMEPFTAAPPALSPLEEARAERARRNAKSK
jgi:hypothetical protein